MNELEELGKELLLLKAKKAELLAKEAALKDKIQAILTAENASELQVQSDGSVLKFKIGSRRTKRFDKSGLADEVGVDRSDLDYKGVSELVENKIITSSTVSKYQSEGLSKFILVRQK